MDYLSTLPLPLSLYADICVRISYVRTNCCARFYPIAPLPPLVGVRFSTGIDGGGADGTTIGPSAEQQLRMTKFVKRLVWYPAVLIASWTFATINRIQNAAHPDHPIFGLFLLHVSGGSGRCGATNILIKTKQEWRII